MDKLYIPALRGVFGDWVYYSCLIPAELVANRINFADELQKSKKLSELIQREIKKTRGKEIATYLRTENERFFNSLVVAVYGGKPNWYEFNVESKNENISIEDVPDFALHSFGFLYFSGNEKLFAVDGQHRLAGIKKVVGGGEALGDEISVILVAHDDKTKKGHQRTRRLFTTLNKTAVAVSKGERIALDENDVMAIVVRRLVEENPKFSGDRIAYKATNNLTPKDVGSLTTIGNLYDVLGILFAKTYQAGNKKVQKPRPKDEELDKYYQAACQYFQLLQDNIPELKEFFEAGDYPDVVKKYRGNFGGSLVFRPIGLTLLTETIEKLAAKYDLKERVRLVSKLPRTLAKEPFANVLWNPIKKTIKALTRERVLARNLMLYMLGEVKSSDELLKDYAEALGKDVQEVQLPKQV